jgi:hypothetical protein
MATAASDSTSRQPEITRPIVERLATLRSQLKRWVVVDGLARWIWLLLGIAALDMAMDRLFKMDFAQRLIVLVLVASAMLAWLVWRVLRPATRTISDDALLLQVEAKHRQLQQKAISGFQLAREKDYSGQGVSPQLAEATIAAGVREAQQVDFSAILDQVRGRNNWLALLGGLAVTALLGIGVTQTDFLQTWFRRNLLLTNDQWPLATNLEVVGAETGKLTLARGSDHRQVVRITPDSFVTNVPVSLEVDAPGGRTIHTMKATGREDGREHAFVFHSIGSDFRFRALGGDAVTDWIAVELVEPPAIASLELQSLLPTYTGRESETLEGTGPHSVLSGSQLLVKMKANKPLAGCELKLGEQRFELAPEGDDRQSFMIRLPNALAAADATAGVAGGKYEFRLRDEGGLENLREFSFTLKTREDRAPDVRASLLGISGLVVPRALVPTSYNVIDEYGLAAIDFDCHWTTEGESAGPNSILVPVARFSGTPVTPEKQDVAVLELEPLKLVPGTSLRFILQASDNQPGGVGLGKSREFLLRVVTEEELLADLLRREIDQRKSFQAAYDAQLEIVSQTRQLGADPGAGLTPSQVLEQRQSELLGIHRGQRSVGTAVDAVAKRFEEFLVEVQNNRLDEETRKVDPNRTIAARFENEIIVPIRQLDQEQVSAAVRNLDNCRRSLNDPAALANAVNETATVQEGILERMRSILAAMEDSENYQEVVNKLLEIKRAEERMQKQLKQKETPDGIFDEPGKDKAAPSPTPKKGVFDDDQNNRP